MKYYDDNPNIKRGNLGLVRKQADSLKDHPRFVALSTFIMFIPPLSHPHQTYDHPPICYYQTQVLKLKKSPNPMPTILKT